MRRCHRLVLPPEKPRQVPSACPPPAPRPALGREDPATRADQLFSRLWLCISTHNSRPGIAFN